MKVRNISVLLLFVPLLMNVCSCSNNATSDEFKEEVINFERIKSVANEGYYVKPNETITIDINYNSLDKNYLKLVIKTEVNVYGRFNYVNIDDETETGSESFYVPKGEEEQELCHFLDAYRPKYNNHEGCGWNKAHRYYNIPLQTKMAQGAFSKRLTNFTIKNVSEEAGSIQVVGLYISDRDLLKEEVYISQGAIKVGVDLMGGGTLTYLERLNYKTSKATYQIDEVLTDENNVYIGVDAANMGVDTELLSTDHHVNLINYYDAGRQFQQSFYASIGGSNYATEGQNGYTRKMCYTGDGAGFFWPYNPVQGGDCHCNISQMVDYKITADTIYIRCKPLDWADNNYVTDSYLENWYHIENEVLTVKNRFTNFAGFTDMESCGTVQLELPAAYIVHPLNRYVTYQGETPWTNDETGLIYNPNLGSWAKSADIVWKHPEDWFAWVNDDNFGVGVYIPDVSFYASGRSNPSVNALDQGNNNAFTSPMGDPDLLKYNKKLCEYSYQSCYVTNTDYTAPEILTTMLDYIPFEYSYAISVDYLPVIRNNFHNLYLDNAIDNSTMFIWDRTIKGDA